jgi:hypothetical protein
VREREKEEEEEEEGGDLFDDGCDRFLILETLRMKLLEVWSLGRAGGTALRVAIRAKITVRLLFGFLDPGNAIWHRSCHRDPRGARDRGGSGCGESFSLLQERRSWSRGVKSCSRGGCMCRDGSLKRVGSLFVHCSSRCKSSRDKGMRKSRS